MDYPPKVKATIKKIDEFMGGTSHANIQRETDKKLDLEKREYESEYDRADNQLMTASLALLAATLAVAYKSTDVYNLFFIVAILSFLISFLFFFWHQLRTSIRKRIYRERHLKWLEDGKFYLSKLITLTAELITLREKVYIYEHVEEVEKLDTNEINDRIKKFSWSNDDENSYIAKGISYLMSEDARKNYEISFLEPLDEKYSKIKNSLDQFSKKWRYRIFIIGVLCFVIGLMIKFFS